VTLALSAILTVKKMLGWMHAALKKDAATTPAAERHAKK
jgi:hypothetical protein